MVGEGWSKLRPPGFRKPFCKSKRTVRYQFVDVQQCNSKDEIMAILDSQGRLFGKVSLLDIGAGLVILLVVAAIFLLPGNSGTSLAQIGNALQPVEVDAIVRGLTVRDPEAFIQSMQESGKTNIVIRNQPAGEIKILKVQPLERTVTVPQPDGSVVAAPDPRPELDYTADMILTLGGEARSTEDGVVIGNNKIKVGTPLELEGKLYRFNASVIGVRSLP